jgi:hydroxyproline O-galactosyltransferase 2/3/4/5/6
VSGMVKCEKCVRDEEGVSEESTASWWLNRLIGPTKKASIE